MKGPKDALWTDLCSSVWRGVVVLGLAGCWYRDVCAGEHS